MSGGGWMRPASWALRSSQGQRLRGEGGRSAYDTTMDVCFVYVYVCVPMCACACIFVASVASAMDRQ